MPAKIEDYNKLTSRYSDLTSEGTQLAGAATGLKANVMQAVRADRAQRGVSQLAQDVGNTLGQIPTDTAGIRQRAGDVVNPMDVDVITARQRGQNLNILGTIAQQSEYEQGTLTDIISEQSSRIKAMAAAKLAEAEQAKYEASALMDQLEYEEGIRQFNETLAEEQRQYNNKKTGSGSADYAAGAAELSKIFQGLGPQLTPKNGVGTKSEDVGYDPGWVYTSNGWVPLASNLDSVIAATAVSGNKDAMKQLVDYIDTLQENKDLNEDDSSGTMTVGGVTYKKDASGKWVPV